MSRRMLLGGAAPGFTLGDNPLASGTILNYNLGYLAVAGGVAAPRAGTVTSITLDTSTAPQTYVALVGYITNISGFDYFVTEAKTTLSETDYGLATYPVSLACAASRRIAVWQSGSGPGGVRLGNTGGTGSWWSSGTVSEPAIGSQTQVGATAWPSPYGLRLQASVA